jgi:hypothetical protein
MFMADSATGMLMLQDNKPLVSFGNAVTQPQSKLVPYTGPITTVQSALTLSGNGVKVMTPNNPTPLDALVNITTLQSITDPQKPGITFYQVKNELDTMKTYIFMADSATGMLMVQDNKPMVSVKTNNQNFSVQPFHGATATIDSVLTISNNQVQLLNQQNGTFTPVTIDHTTIHSIPDTKMAGQMPIIAVRTDDPTKTVVFTSRPENQAIVNIDSATNSPIVVEMVL